MLGEVLTAILTPFHPDGSVNVAKFRELAAHLVDHGSDGVVVAGTTGESPTLTDEEKLQLFAAAVEAVGDRATVVAGTGTYDTGHSVHLTKLAHEAGVDAMLVVTPYYNKPPQRAIVRHFQEIAAATDKPIVVYNIPSRVVVNIEPETIAQLAKIPNVRAVKQAHDDLDEARRIPEPGPRPVCRRRQPDLPVPRARRHRRNLRPHARLGPADEGDGPPAGRAATPTARGASTRRWRPPSTS